MGNEGLSTGDLALLQNDGGMGGANAWVWFFMLMFLAGNGNWGGGGNYNGNLVTQSELTNQLNAQAQSAQLQQLGLTIGNQNYETAQQINGLQTNLMSQNNTNLINAIQGFNQVNLGLQNQTNVLAQQIQALQAKLDSCCCEIKTQMLQNRYEDERAANVALRNDISNYNQSQYLLGQTGRWVGWATSGAPTTTTGN